MNTNTIKEIVRVRLQNNKIDIVQLVDGSILTFNDIKNAFEIFGENFIFNFGDKKVALKYKNDIITEPKISDLQKINNL